MKAYAKINLGLVVGPVRADGKHEVATLLQRVSLHDDVVLEPAAVTAVEGYEEDTIVGDALDALAHSAAVESGWRVRIEKRIPVAAGLAGGSSDAATALRLANATLAAPLAAGDLHALAASIGADVPFFLEGGSKLATGDGTTLAPASVPTGYSVLIVLPDGVTKDSTRSVYAAFDRRDGAVGFDDRVARFLATASSLHSADDLAALPLNDLGSSPLPDVLLGLGAFRADVSGAGPAVYGLFRDARAAASAEQAVRSEGRTFLTTPV